MSNFTFIQISELKSLAMTAEQSAVTDPRSACVNARIALEVAIEWMFANDNDLTRPYESNLNAYLKEASFRESTPPHIVSSCEVIRRSGNQAAHEARPIPPHVSHQVVGELHKVLYWFSRVYFDDKIQSTFDPSLIPTGHVVKDKGKEEAQNLAEKYAKKLEEERAKQALLVEENEKLKAEVAKNKAAAKTKLDSHDYSEDETRRFFVDLLLQEAGWKVGSDSVKIEYELTGVKRNSTRTGLGYADYVLWGNDGLPLAVIEVKRTSRDAVEGKLQAEDYADALETKFKRRPLIFYSNGYEVYFWDDQMYPPRRVAGFFKRDELELAIQRRNTRKSIQSAKVNEDIAGRPYQISAIRGICSHFEEHHRRALVVMATGTGKTRTAIALVELLQKANWAKRVLFLCDRDALINQTKRAFTSCLPNTPSVDLRSTRTDTTARVCLSTYPTMMNLIDEMEDGVRPFSPAHFDLIIIDEAHRSIYQKYQALFQYFDGLLLGLTATPRSEVDRNTYQMFDLEEYNPTYAFELEEAIAKGYLVPYESIKVATSFTRSGIKYEDLSPQEREEYEDHFSDPVTGEMPPEIGPEALNRWLFNRPTVESLIKNLMEYGIKVEGGDKIGKTIIFALNSKHAQFIVEVFDKAFPKWAGKLCARIDYSLGKDAQPLIDKFSDPKSFPMIAVSVDMLDTGIDIPEVVNLVFAKPVYSQVKFWQMIGRGTRTCDHLFGPGSVEDPKSDDKTHFLIMDYCGNLDFFSANPKGKITPVAESVTTRLFKTSLSLSRLILEKGSKDDFEVSDRHLEFCKNFVAGLNDQSFIIRPALRHIEKFRGKDIWKALSDEDVGELITHIAPLPSEVDIGDEDARRWDLLLLQGEVYFLESSPKLTTVKTSVQATALDLKKRTSIPEVKKVFSLLEAILRDEYWEKINLKALDEIRLGMRHLIQYIDPASRKLVYTNFADKVTEIEKVDLPPGTGVDLTQYKKRMDKLLEENRDHIVLNKLRHLVPLTPLDLSELDRLLFNGGEDAREIFKKLYGDKSRVQFQIEDPPISLLIRSIIGLERSDVEAKLAEYINTSSFSTHQLSFVKMLVDCFVRDGYVPPSALYDPPFDQFHIGGPDELFGDDSGKIFDFVEVANCLALGPILRNITNGKRKAMNS